MLPLSCEIATPESCPGWIKSLCPLFWEDHSDDPLASVTPRSWRGVGGWVRNLPGRQVESSGRPYCWGERGKGSSPELGTRPSHLLPPEQHSCEVYFNPQHQLGPCSICGWSSPWPAAGTSRPGAGQEAQFPPDWWSHTLPALPLLAPFSTG